MATESPEYPSKLIRMWYEENGIQSHHLESFNDFVYNGIRNIIRSTPIQFTTSKSVKVEIILDNIFVTKPYVYDENRKKAALTPYNCLSTGSTYSSPVFVSVLEIKDGVKTVLDRLSLFNLPIMVRSDFCYLKKYNRTQGMECEKDPGGYFIINGIDRVLVTQQRNIYNMVQVFEEQNSVKYKYKAEIRSMSEDTNHSILIESFLSHDGCSIGINLPYTKSVIGFAIIMRAFDVNLNDCIDMVCSFSKEEYKEPMKQSVEKMYRSLNAEISSREDALKYIGSQGSKIDSKTDIVNYALQILQIELFPHLGVFSTDDRKVEFLCYIAYRLYAVNMGILQIHDRDNLAYKRYESSGILLFELFKSLYRSCVQEIEVDYEKGMNIIDIFNKIDAGITKNIKYCFSTGKWGVQRNSYIRQGVSQVLSRLSYVATLSHMQRIVVPVGKEGKNFKIRQIHSTAFGYICLYETPEGQSCGIVLNMTISTTISAAHSFRTLRKILLSLIMDYKTSSTGCPCFLNGIIITRVSDPLVTTNILRNYRRRGYIPWDISICYDSQENEIRIFCDKGRLIRPFICNPNYTDWIDKINSFSQAVQNGFVEWLDSNEVQQRIIGMHLSEKADGIDAWEIHPSFLMGICAGAIPFSNHNQSPRNVYESSMMKQAIGMFSTSYNHRFDSVFHTLDYPQKSIVSTQTARLVGMHDMPAGINCVVAVCTYGGWNAEDSVIINRSAIERGLFCSNTYHTYTFEDKTYKTSVHKKICIPPVELQKYELNYYHLDKNGIVRKGACVQKNDVIVGRIQISTEYKDGEAIENYTDCSEVSEHDGTIDRVETFHTPNGNSVIRIIIRQVRIPEIGDKFANMAAQKGTCALILSQEDLPFTGDGTVPDIIMNAHALPSRMTISMILEMILGKICALKGELGDATPFSDDILGLIEEIGESLAHAGFDSKGWEVMYNGYTGEPFQSKIYVGLSYYQRLKHMVTEKIHARSYGNVTSLTRQPLAGRSKDGGLRLGEMERDALLSHGSVQFLRERLFDMSDPFSVLICNNCGVISNYKDECHICLSNELMQTSIPYAAKLVFQMLNGCLIKTSFHSSIQ